MSDKQQPDRLTTEPSKEAAPRVNAPRSGVQPIGLITPDEILGTTIWQPRRSPLLRGLERLALAIARPINRLIGNPALNPLYHTDTIAVYLWLIVAVTGLYLSFFVQFSFKGVYEMIAKMESQLVAHVIRAIHRYASDAAIIVSVMHGFRLFFMGKFRGPRWLAWVTGVLMVAVLIVDGVLGYWLVWDTRAQLIMTSITNWLGRVFGTGANFVASIQAAEANDTSWIWIGLLLLVHIALFGLVAYGYWLHVKRLSRPKFLPARHWLIGVGVLVLIISALMPVGMLPPARLDRLPGPVQLDPIFLFFIPAEVNGTANGLWLVTLAIIAGFAIFPWLPSRRRSPLPVQIDKNRCTGCTECALDCPYHAITMLPRTDGKIHKFVAQENPDLCVSCGLCVGSCGVQAITVGLLSYSALWAIIEKKVSVARQRTPTGNVTVVFTCDRHADNGAQPFLNPADSANFDPSLEVITLPCTASAPPDLIARSLDIGASEARIIGCAPGDCARREGNVWAEGRLSRNRVPRLRRSYANAPIGTYWLPPDDFKQALRAPLQTDRPAPGRMATPLRWRNLIPALLLVALLYVVSSGLSGIPYTPYSQGQAHIQIVVPSPAVLFKERADRQTADYTATPMRLSLHVDGQSLFERDFAPGELNAGQTAALYQDVALAPGEHRIRFAFDGGDGSTITVYDRRITLKDQQVLLLDYIAGSAHVDRRKPSEPH